MKKFLSSFLIILLAVAVFVAVAKDWILKTAIEQGVTKVTGFGTTVESLKYQFPSTIHITGLNVKNPKGFQEKTFVNIPEIYASVVLGEILNGSRIHLPEVRLNVQEVHIEKNEKGVSNVELLSSLGGSGGKTPASKPAPSAGEQKPPMPFLLEKLQLTIRNVSFADRSGLMASAPLPKKMEMDLNVQNEVITNIADAKSLVNIIVSKILNGATLGKLLNIDPQALMSESLSGVTESGKELLNQSTEALTKQLGDVSSQAKDLVGSSDVTKKAEALLGSSSESAKNVLGDAAGSAKDQVSGLFGKLKSLTPGEEAPAETAVKS